MDAAIALLGLCITVVSLFQVTNNTELVYTDDGYMIAGGCFALRVVLSEVVHVWTGQLWALKLAAVCFRVGVFVMLCSTILLGCVNP